MVANGTNRNGIQQQQAREHGVTECSRPNIVAVIPAYNEERFIGSVVLNAKKHADTVIVVDDGSQDATAELAEEAGAVVVQQVPNQGKGAALRAGFQRAMAFRPDVVITLDADGQHVAGEMLTVAGPILDGEADIVVGSRYLNGDSKVPQHRILGHHLFNFMTNQSSGVHVTDSQSGFRAFSRQALQAISFQSNGFSVESEMQFIAEENQLRMVEAPITIHYHDKPKRPVLAHGLMVLNGLLQMMGQYRPLLFFGLPGILLLTIAGGWSLWIVHIFKTTRQLAIGYALISVLLFLVGNTVMTTGIILHSVRGLLLDYSAQTRSFLSGVDRSRPCPWLGKEESGRGGS